MGYSEDKRTFTPDNTDTAFYIVSENWNQNGKFPSLNEIITMAKDHFGSRVTYDNISINSEHIQTDGLGWYQSSDSGDYTNYIRVTLNE